MYTDSKTQVNTKRNIANLSIFLWDVTSEKMRYEIGSKFGLYRVNGDVSAKENAAAFLDLVEGNAYKDEDSIAAELIQTLGILKSTHFDWNNFYNEEPLAETLKRMLPSNGQIPIAARNLWVKVICLCYVGNGKGYREGVDESALILYEEFLENFNENEIIEFLFLFDDIEFTTDLSKSKPDTRMRKLANLFLNKTNNTFIKQALQCIIDGPNCKLDRMSGITQYKTILSKIKLL